MILYNGFEIEHYFSDGYHYFCIKECNLITPAHIEFSAAFENMKQEADYMRAKLSKNK